MELIDTHAHLTFEQLIGDVDVVLKRSREASVTRWITVGTEPKENPQVVELASQHDGLFAALGIHPHYAKNATDDDLVELKTLAADEKVVAIGETGLDYHYDFSPKDQQLALFESHLSIAAGSNLPVIVHSREAFDDTVSVLDNFQGILKDVVFHCYSYSPEQAKLLLDKGYHISFTGVVTFKNAETTRSAAKAVPLDRMMIETDCPFMSPAPMRKQKTNEPALLIHTAKLLAELKNVSIETLAQKTTQTAKNFFNLPD